MSRLARAIGASGAIGRIRAIGTLGTIGTIGLTALGLALVGASEVRAAAVRRRAGAFTRERRPEDLHLPGL